MLKLRTPGCDPNDLDQVVGYWQLLVNQIATWCEAGSVIFEWFDDRLFLAPFVVRGGDPGARLDLGDTGAVAPSPTAAGDHQVSLHISLGDQSYARVVIVHKIQDADAIKEIERQLEELEPAVRCALATCRRAIRLLVSEARLHAQLEVHVRPMLLLDGSRTVIAANAGASSSIMAGKGLGLSSDGKLKCDDPQDSENLAAAVASLASSSIGYTKPQECRIVLSFRELPAELEHHVVLSPLVTAPLGVSSGSAPRLRLEPWVAAEICFHDAPLPVSQALLKKTFKLTDAQARMAEALLQGTSLKEYANRANIRMTTARWHVSEILAKTNSRSQMDFVRLALRLFE